METKRIVAIAFRNQGQVVYALKEPSISAGDNIYTLNLVAIGHPSKPRMLLRTHFIGELQRRPGTSDVTFVADLGGGVQVYRLTKDNRVNLFLSSPRTSLLGGDRGVQTSNDEEARRFGIVSFEWSPDGRHFWYSRVLERSEDEQRTIVDKGIIYDDRAMSGATPGDIAKTSGLVGTELRLFDAVTRDDRRLTFVPPSSLIDEELFRRKAGSIHWLDDTHIQFWQRNMLADELSYSIVRLNVRTGAIERLDHQEGSKVAYSIPTINGFLSVRSVAGANRLSEWDLKGQLARDLGPVPYSRLDTPAGLAFELGSGSVLTSVEVGPEEPLAVISSTHAGATRLIGDHGTLQNCAVDPAFSRTACSYETVAEPPSLVSIDLASGRRTTIAEPNAALRTRRPLHRNFLTLRSSVGDVCEGFVTYSDEDHRRAKPGLVISHGWDARNRFAYDFLQWQYPLQVFADRGYYVIAINEPAAAANSAAYDPGAATKGVSALQEYEVVKPLHCMEAAAAHLVSTYGVARDRIGIAGFSRGATTVRYAMSHSHSFAAGSSGDLAWWDASGFWGGNALYRTAYANLFGGAPYDRNAVENYRTYSPTFNTANFSGPLLQQFRGDYVSGALEMDQLLRQSKIPTELIFFPGETHIFWNPRHRAAAMVQNLDWFDYWLLGERHEHDGASAQYVRWDAMGREWGTKAEPRGN